jgi:phosphatidylglycerol lysyltransferase
MTRRWIVWLLVLAFLALVLTRLNEVEHLVATLLQGNLAWIAAAVAVQAVYYLAYTGLYVSAFRSVDVAARLTGTLPLVFTSLFVNVVAPTGGATGAAVFVDDASRRGQSAARAATATLIVLLCDFAAFALILLAGLAYLLTYHDLKPYELIASVILLAMVAGLGFGLGLALWRVTWVERILGAVRRVVNRVGRLLHRPDVLRPDWALDTTRELSSAAQALRAHPGRLTATFGFALLAHGLDLLTLRILFLAYGQAVSPGVLVAAYSIGILFWIVSITPQGIGVVEGMMALVLISLGIPSAQATVVSLAFRGLSFWLPLLVGAVTVRRLSAGAARAAQRDDTWKVHLLALLTALMGLVNILSAVTPSLPARVDALRSILPLAVRHGSHLAAALAGFALLLIADGLWRRKQLAWGMAVGMLVASAFTHMLKGLDYEEATLALLLVVALVAYRSHFQARSDVPSVQRGLAVLLAAFAFTLVYGTAGFYLLDRHFRVHYALGPALRQTVTMFTQFTDPGLEPTTGFGRYFSDSIYLVALFTGGYALLMLLRPVLMRRPASAEARRRAAQIVQAYGRSSLARMTLFDDKAYFFSPGGTVIAYVARGRAAIALGDPIGPPEDFEAAVRAFQQLCARNDWVPCFYQVLPDGLEVYARAGFDSLCVGQEAIVELASFHLEGHSYKHVRSAIHRLTRQGFHTDLLRPPLPENLLRELRSVSDEWLTTMHGSEKRFSLGWFHDDYIRNSPVLAMRDAQGRILAFANIVPEYQLNEVTIDLMRHRASAPPGTMDMLFVALFEWAHSQGYDTFNLGLSGLSGVGERPSDPVLEKALYLIYEHVSAFYNFKGLHAFKAKFDPRWSPRYLIYPGSTSLPAILAGLARNQSPNEPTGDAPRDGDGIPRLL